MFPELLFRVGVGGLVEHSFLCKSPIKMLATIGLIFLRFTSSLPGHFVLFFKMISLAMSIADVALLFANIIVRPPQTAILLFCISFPWAWS